MNTIVIFKRKVKRCIKQLILATGVQQRKFSCKTYLFQRLLLSSKVSQLFLQRCHLEFQLLPALLFTFESGLCLLRGFLELWDVTADTLSCRTRATACYTASQKLLRSCTLWSPKPTTQASLPQSFQLSPHWPDIDSSSHIVTSPLTHIKRESSKQLEATLKMYHSHNPLQPLSQHVRQLCLALVQPFLTGWVKYFQVSW